MRDRPSILFFRALYRAAPAHAIAFWACLIALGAHRFSTVRMADLIVVLSGSRVVEVGAHDELMAKRGTYAELFDIQATAFR